MAWLVTDQRAATGSEDGLVSRWAVRHLGWAVGGGVSTEVELLACGIHL